MARGQRNGLTKMIATECRSVSCAGEATGRMPSSMYWLYRSELQRSETPVISNRVDMDGDVTQAPAMAAH